MDVNTEASAEPGVRAGRREWLGLAVLALPTMLLALDLSVLYLALPHLAGDLGATSTQQLWITDIYGFLVAGFLVTMGTLGDRVGRKRLMMIGAVLFTAASTLAAFSGSPEMLIISRALMGITGATLMPSTLALITNMFKDPKEQGMAIGVWMTAFMGGMVLGPIVGGTLLEFFWWGSVFLLAIPVMGLLLVAGPGLLPEHRNPEAGKLDLISVVLSLGTLLPVIYGLKELAKGDFGTWPAIAIIGGVVVGFLFVRRQRHLEHPLLDLTLFSNKILRGALLLMTLGGIMSGTYLLINLYMQVVENLSPLGVALWLLPSAAVTIMSAGMAPMIAQKVRPGYVIAGGLVLVVIGYLLITQVEATGGMTLLIIGLVVSGIGGGAMGSLGTGLTMTSAPPEKAGSAAALSETSGELGIALGVASMGMVGTAVYQLEADGLGAGAPPHIAEAAQESVAGALAHAGSVGGQAGADLLAGAQQAFTSSLNVAALVSAGIALLLAIIAATLLRSVPPTGTPAEEGEDAGGDADGEAIVAEAEAEVRATDDAPEDEPEKAPANV